ncbi:MAG: hypothetical protein QG656_2745 [Candidatus Hydrogenedentes bacterium]|nr:hypothetical protein [Candidatus Hydrogenedentota bacterium]
MAAKSMYEKVLELCAQFVVKRKGAWEHDDWERFLIKAAQAGVELSDESKRNLGNILEGAKYFYLAAPPPAPKKPAKKRASKKAAPKKAAAE